MNEEVRPGYQKIQLEYLVDSLASEQEIQSLIEHVERTSPVLDIIGNPVPVERSLSVTKGG